MRIRRFYGSRRCVLLVLITYDISTEDAEGRRRLRKVAKTCMNYGQRVQNSVFECQIDAAQCRMLELVLADIIDTEHDSLRFYYLGDHAEMKVKHIGTKVSYDPKAAIII